MKHDLKSTSPIRIVTAADEAYAMPLGVMLCSVFENKRKEDAIEVFVLVDEKGFSSESLAKHQEIISKYVNTSIQYLTISRDDYKSFNVNIDYINLVTYYRFSLDLLLDESIDRVLYLDCDLVVNTDIRKLWVTELNGYIIGAVEDGATVHPESDWAANLKRKLRLPTGSKYFNAGVLLIDLGKWRKENISAKCIRLIQEFPEQITLNDQDALNFIMIKKWLPLSFKWNTTTTLLTHGYKYSKKDVTEAINNPFIIHYTSSNKPWNNHTVHPARQNFLKYWKISPWYPLYSCLKCDKIKDGVTLLSICDASRFLKKAIESWLEAKEIKEIVLVYEENDKEVSRIVEEIDNSAIVSILFNSLKGQKATAACNLAASMGGFNKLLCLDCCFLIYDGFFENHPLSENQVYYFRYWSDWFHSTRFLNAGFFIHKADFFSVNGLNEQISVYESHLELFRRFEIQSFEMIPLNFHYMFLMSESKSVNDFQPLTEITIDSDRGKFLFQKEFTSVLCENLPWTLGQQMQIYSLKQCPGRKYYALEESRSLKIPNQNEREVIATEALKRFIFKIVPNERRSWHFNNLINKADLETLKSFYHFINSPENAIQLFKKDSNSQYQVLQSEMEQNVELKEIYKSFSWKIGHRITRILVFLIGWTPYFKKRFPNG